MSKTFANSINNNPLYAERAEQDASGNTITTTYATKSEVSAVADVPDVTSSDNGKVLKATYENGAGSYGWASEVKKPIVAGANITITNNTNDVTIAATDTTYTFSTGLTNSSGTVSVTNPLPSSTSSDEDKVLTVDSTGAPVWAASQGGGNEVPSVTSSDDGKVLKATYSGGTGSYDWASPPTEKTLAAGSNVSISASGSTVTISATDTTYTFSTGLTNTSGTITVDNPVPSVTSNDGGKVLTAAYSGGVGSYSWVTPSGGGGSGDKFTYHAPAHSIIFWFFENPSFDPSQDQTLSNILYANWTQLSSESNIWQLSLNSGTWANEFYDNVNVRSLFPVAFDILSINFSGVTSIDYAFRYAPVRHIHEVLGTITGSANYAFSDTTKLRGHVNIPEIASYWTDYMFMESTLDSIHIGKLYYEYYPAIEGDPDIGEPGYDEYYTCSHCTSMFYNCQNLKFVDFGVAYLADCSSMFSNCINLQNAAFVNQCVFGSSTLNRMFQDCKSLIWCPDFYFNHKIDQTSMDQYESMVSASHMFDGCSSLLRIPGFSGTTSNCSDLSYMFYNCSSLVSIQWMKIQDIGYSSYEDLDPDTGDPTWVTTYNVSNVQNMFSLCSNVIGGAANAYQQMSATWTNISNHSDAFYVGSDVGRPEASQIPTSWGGSQS